MSQTHIHHVIPRSRGGTDEPTNLVEIDFIEHARLHAEDYLQGGPSFDFRQPGWSFLEDELREKVLACHSEKVRQNNPNAGTGRNFRDGCPCPEHVKQILSEVHKGNKYRLGSTWTEELREFHHLERLGKVWWVNTETGETSKSKTCPGPEWTRGRKIPTP